MEREEEEAKNLGGTKSITFLLYQLKNPGGFFYFFIEGRTDSRLVGPEYPSNLLLWNTGKDTSWTFTYYLFLYYYISHKRMRF